MAHDGRSHMTCARWVLGACILIATAVAGAGLLAPGPAAATAAAHGFAAQQGAPMMWVPLPLPLQLASIGDSQQLLIATGTKLGATSGTLWMFELVNGVWVQRLKVAARFGKRGLIDGTRRTEGSNTTPTGIWFLPDYIFGSHRYAPVGTKMDYRRLDAKSWWSSRRGSTYNTWVEARHWTGEHIGGSPKAYEFAVSTGYNALPNQSVYGRGTAIFLHVRGSGYTAGCVAISRAGMIRVCKMLDQNKHPEFAIGTLRRGTATSIWAY